MFSPHSGDDMLAQVWNWSEYLSTYFTGEISFVLSFLFQYMANEAMNKIRKSQKEKKKTSGLQGKVLEMLPRLKKNGAANVRKIGRRYHKIFRPCELVGWKIYFFFQKALHPTSKPLTCRQHWPLPHQPPGWPPRQPPCPSPHYLFCHQSIYSKCSI